MVCWEMALNRFLSLIFTCSLIPGAKRSHRGVREGKVTKPGKIKQDAVSKTKPTKKAKLSTLRRNEMMGQPAGGSNKLQLFAAERSKDMRTLQAKQNLLVWVSLVIFIFLFSSLPSDRRGNTVKLTLIYHRKKLKRD